MCRRRRRCRCRRARMGALRAAMPVLPVSSQCSNASWVRLEHGCVWKWRGRSASAAGVPSAFAAPKWAGLRVGMVGMAVQGLQLTHLSLWARGRRAARPCAAADKTIRLSAQQLQRQQINGPMQASQMDRATLPAARHRPRSLRPCIQVVVPVGQPGDSPPLPAGPVSGWMAEVGRRGDRRQASTTELAPAPTVMMMMSPPPINARHHDVPPWPSHALLWTIEPPGSQNTSWQRRSARGTNAWRWTVWRRLATLATASSEQ